MNLREWLYKNKISVTYFAKAIDMNRSYVHKLMSGNHVPSEKVVNKIRNISLNQVSSADEIKDIIREQLEFDLGGLEIK